MMEKEIVEKEVEEFGDPSWAVDSALDLVNIIGTQEMSLDMGLARHLHHV